MTGKIVRDTYFKDKYLVTKEERCAVVRNCSTNIKKGCPKKLLDLLKLGTSQESFWPKAKLFEIVGNRICAKYFKIVNPVGRPRKRNE